MNYASPDLRARYRRTRRLADWLTFDQYWHDPEKYDRAYYGLVIAWERMDAMRLHVLGGLDPAGIHVDLHLN